MLPTSLVQVVRDFSVFEDLLGGFNPLHEVIIMEATMVLRDPNNDIEVVSFAYSDRHLGFTNVRD